MNSENTIALLILIAFVGLGYMVEQPGLIGILGVALAGVVFISALAHANKD